MHKRTAQKTTKQNAIRFGKRLVQCNYVNQTLITFSWDMWHPLFPDQTIFDFPTSIFNHIHNKIVSAQRNIHGTQILYLVPTNNWFFRGELLFERRKRYARLDPFFALYQVIV